jgi:hypothetical protein
MRRVNGHQPSADTVPRGPKLGAAARAKLEADAWVLARAVIAEETDDERPRPLDQATRRTPKRSKRPVRTRSATANG